MSWIIPVKLEDIDMFWVSFWAALYSGIIYSIITGVIVGLVIWFVQSKVERKKEIKQYKIEVDVFKSKLRMLVGRSNAISIDSITNFQPAVIETINYVNEYPIMTWEQNLKSERDLMMLLKKIQNDYLKGLSNAEKLDNYLVGFIRRFNSERNSISSNDRFAYIYFVGRLFECDDEDIIPWLDPTNQIPEWVNGFYQYSIKDDAIMKLSRSYMDIRNELDNDMTQLKKSLGYYW